MKVLFIVHLLICITVLLLYKYNRFSNRDNLVVLVICIPFWGLVALVVHEIVIRTGKAGRREIELEQMKLIDEKYRKINVANDENQHITVPLEEAILINDAKTRRALMLDILYRNPAEYVDLLQKTTLSNDIELTHYATTTIMEVQSNYEAQLQKCEHEWKEKQEDVQLLKRYIALLDRYVKSGLLTGNVLLIKQVQLETVLEKYRKLVPDDKDNFLLYIQMELTLDHMDQIPTLLAEAKAQWSDEKIYMLEVMYYHKTGQAKEIHQLLKEIKDHHIYLSHEGRKWYEFWNRENYCHE